MKRFKKMQRGPRVTRFFAAAPASTLKNQAGMEGSGSLPKTPKETSA
jgi:hypothetical protein